METTLFEAGEDLHGAGGIEPPDAFDPNMATVDGTVPGIQHTRGAIAFKRATFVAMSPFS